MFKLFTRDYGLDNEWNSRNLQEDISHDILAFIGKVTYVYCLAISSLTAAQPPVLVTMSTAQGLPQQVLRCIFSFLTCRGPACRRALENCTLVCRSWTYESSALLLHHVKLSLDVDWWTRGRSINSPRKPRLGSRHPLRFPLRSPRITAYLQSLEVTDDATCRNHAWVDCALLRSAVQSLPNLLSLSVGPLSFDSPSSKDARRGPVHLGLHIDRLVLCSHCLAVEGRTTPNLLDILTWFNTIDHLELFQLKGREDMSPLEKADKDWKVAVKKLTLDPRALRSFLEDLDPLGVIDLRSLRALAISGVEPTTPAAIDTVLKLYGDRLEHCSLLHWDYRCSQSSGM